MEAEEIKVEALRLGRPVGVSEAKYRGLKVEFGKWLEVPKKIRSPGTAAGWAKLHGVSEQACVKWAKMKASGVPMEETPDSAYIGKLEKIAFEKNGTSADRRLFLEMKGLVRKQEAPSLLELSGDDIYKILNEARERVNRVCGAVNRVGSVSDVGKVLSDAVCVDTEQEHSEDGEVGGVAVST